MRYILISCFMIYFLLFTQVTLADERMKEVTINSYHVDLQQNGTKENIHLKGNPFSKQSAYYPRIWAEIKEDSSKVRKIELGGGYKPSLKFIDYNHNQKEDILYQSSTTENESEVFNYKLISIKKDNIEEIRLPKREYMELTFKDNFYLTVKLTPQLSPLSIDISNRSKELTRLGMYSSNGKVLKEKPVINRHITSFDPIELSGGKGYGLKSKMKLSLSSSSTHLGVIETLWYFKDGKWTILKTNLM
ncbi:hypothetical protein GLV94_10600 [Virgibacillus halodenitrificans]|uniref:Uncharacterized protein n=2 Tax=Virgibacillus halodenitrificans TaxID=1482 RepID=A0AAC9J0Z8_VIRHA|nr:hypothetical protein [Virgibacillus halodenitrificans]APC48885.1 hypothetical protein BME96_12075 [Virgibacillus halodenitrificans]MYL46101.1 hypothetical protein [Virgibacillus halodenitrificans]